MKQENHRVDIDPKRIEAELQDLAGNEKVKVKLSKHIEKASSIVNTDKGYLIKLNPSKIRSPKTLEDHLNICRHIITM